MLAYCSTLRVHHHHVKRRSVRTSAPGAEEAEAVAVVGRGRTRSPATTPSQPYRSILYVHARQSMNG